MQTATLYNSFVPHVIDSGPRSQLSNGRNTYLLWPAQYLWTNPRWFLPNNNRRRDAMIELEAERNIALMRNEFRLNGYNDHPVGSEFDAYRYNRPVNQNNNRPDVFWKYGFSDAEREKFKKNFLVPLSSSSLVCSLGCNFCIPTLQARTILESNHSICGMHDRWCRCCNFRDEQIPECVTEVPKDDDGGSDNKDYNDENTCDICMDNRKDICLGACRHRMCRRCLRMLKRSAKEDKNELNPFKEAKCPCCSEIIFSVKNPEVRLQNVAPWLSILPGANRENLCCLCKKCTQFPGSICVSLNCTMRTIVCTDCMKENDFKTKMVYTECKGCATSGNYIRKIF